MKVEFETDVRGGDAFAEFERSIRAAGRVGVSRLPPDPAGTRGAPRPGKADSSSGTATPRPRGWCASPPAPPTSAPRNASRAWASRSRRYAGSPIEYFGTMDLELHDEHGGKWRIMQADQSLYLYPGRVQTAIGFGPGDRRGRLSGRGGRSGPHYRRAPGQASPVRVLGLSRGVGGGSEYVHPESSPRGAAGEDDSRPGGRRVPKRGRRAGPFPGWSAAEIHTAMNESTLSAETSRVLTRVGRALGVRDGTGPDDMAWLREQRAVPRAEGRSKGWDRGRLATLRTVVHRTLAVRGIAGARGASRCPRHHRRDR